MEAQTVRNHSFDSLKPSTDNATAAVLMHPVTHFSVLFAVVMYLVYDSVVLGIKP